MIGDGRIREIRWMFLLIGGVLIGRLVQLQVVEHDFWSTEAVKARSRSWTTPSRRGSIVDTKGRELASSESVYDLQFRFGDFRKGTQAGRLMLAQYLLSGERVRIGDVLSTPTRVLEHLVPLTVAEYRSIEPRQRRLDLCTYVSWLRGKESSSELIEFLNHAPPDELFCRPLVEEWNAIADTVSVEAHFVQELELRLGWQPGELTQRMDEAIEWIDERVLIALAKRGDVEDRAFEIERELHREYDYRPRMAARNVPHNAVFELMVDPQRFAGLVPLEATRRVYPEEDETCALLIGWVGGPSEELLEQSRRHQSRLDTLLVKPEIGHEDAREMTVLREAIRETDYRAEDEVGRFGLEATYEDLLRGRRGYRKVETDRLGQVVRVLEEVPATPGMDVVLTLDRRWQQVAETILDQQAWTGSFVLLELPEARIRVLASSPRLTRDDIRQHGFADPRGQFAGHPRAYGPYFPPPPGSVVKPLVAAMAISQGVLDPDETLFCNQNRLGPDNHPVRCLGNHQDVRVGPAITKSCNHFFARLAIRLGYEQLFHWMEDFGFGRSTGFASLDLQEPRRLFPPEVPGTMNQRERGERNLMVFGFGQGAIDDVTPLQVAASMAALAQRRYVPPVLVERIGERKTVRSEGDPLEITPEVWEQVVESMRQVTLPPDGTAMPGRQEGLDLSGYDLATKTGTPQIQDQEDSSWIAGFFPSKAPKYAFALLQEHTGLHGGDACAPVLQQILQSPPMHDLEQLARRGDPP